MAKNEQVNIDLTATDDASKTIDKVADKVEDLEKLDPEVEVTADASKAEADIKSVTDDVERLSRADADIVLRAKVDAAKGELKSLQAELDQTGDKARITAKQLDDVNKGPSGGGARGNAIADLTGPLGDASGAASDFAGVMDGLDDIMADTLGKMGASDKTIGMMSSAMGGLGIAVAAGAAAWAFFKQRQEEARRKLEELTNKQRDLTAAIRDGDRAAALTNFEELYGDALDAAHELGVSTDDFVGYLQGVRDELPGVASRLDELNRAADDSLDVNGRLNPELENAAAAYENLTFKTRDARAQYLELNGTAAEQTARQKEVAKALGLAADEADDAGRAMSRLEVKADATRRGFQRLRDGLSMEQAILTFEQTLLGALETVDGKVEVTQEEILSIKQSILDVAETAKLNPVEVEALLKQVETGDLLPVLSQLQSLVNQQPPILIPTQFRPPTTAAGTGPRDPNAPYPTMVQPDAGGTVNVFQTIPRGWRGDPLADAERAARRSGGLYRRSRR